MRRLIVLVHDIVAAALAWMAAFWLRFNFGRLPSADARPAAVGLHPARIFLAGGLGLIGRRGDATVTLFRRLLRRGTTYTGWIDMRWTHFEREAERSA